MKVVKSNLAAPEKRLVGDKEHRLPSDVLVRYLYAPGKLEGGRHRSTDPIWSVTVHQIERAVVENGNPMLYYLFDGPKRAFVRGELSRAN